MLDDTTQPPQMGGGNGDDDSDNEVGEDVALVDNSVDSFVNSNDDSSSDYDNIISDRSNPQSDEGPRVPVAIPSNIVPPELIELRTAFQGRLKTYVLRNMEVAAQQTVQQFLVRMFEILVNLFKIIMVHVNGVKTNLWLECEFGNVHGETCLRSFKTRNMVVLRTTDLEELCGELFQKLVDEKEACEMKGSGWTFLRIKNFEIRVNVYKPLRGLKYVPLPTDLINRKAVINVPNVDDKCFYYAVLTPFLNNPHHTKVRMSMFKPEVAERSNLDFSELVYPVGIDQMDRFEKKNNISINVFGVEVKESRFGNIVRSHSTVYPLRVVKEEKDRHFDLLYLTNEATTHWAYISNFERLVHSQLTRNHGKLHICKRCFAHFDNSARRDGSGAERLAKHREYCREHAPLRTDLAKKPHIQFDHPERTQRARFTVYADFECALVPIDEIVVGENQAPPTVPAPEGDPASDRPGLPHHRHRVDGDIDVHRSPNVTTRTIHKPYAYAYYVHDSLWDVNGGNAASVNGVASAVGGRVPQPFRMYRGEDASAHFLRTLREDIKHIGDILYAHRQNRPRLTQQEEAAFQAATHCYLCSGPFVEDPKNIKVRDHQHAPPYAYRGAAHQKCNLKYREQDTVNVYFHNLSNYDAHFVVRELGIDSGEVNVLANTEERFITFTKRFKYEGAGQHNRIAVRFVDSYRFLAKALSSLVSILSPDQLAITKKFFPEQAEFDLLRRKGVFPYELVTSADVLDQITELPPVSDFHDSLRMEDVTPEDYAHAQRVWRTFKCATLGEYADVYLKTDVVLLADVYESFRAMCLEHYGLDPAHYVTLPSYAWEVMLKKTGVILDTLRDVDMYQFFERGIRGGLTQCVTRHVVADNKYIRNEPKAAGRDDDTYLLYLDANNLYGWAMTQALPTGGFRWLSAEEIAALDVSQISDENEKGYVLEVDIEYPRDHNLHDRHRDMPFLPEMRKAPADQLPYSREVVREYGVGRSKKLMVSLLDKDRYVVHYRYLKQALANGLRIRRVHRVIEFNQSRWLEPYVKLNTELRRQARSQFEIELFKLMVNAVYGMSLQNVRKHIDIRLATNPVTYSKYVAKSNFSDRTWYTENLALVHMHKTHVVLDKPVYVGMCILDHSKWWMYGFHYKMVNKYNNVGGNTDRIRLVYQDTDSLVYKICTRDVYDDVRSIAEEFDFSNYPPHHPLYNPVNAKVLGKFKDEAGGHIMKEFIGLMSKLYCYTFHGSDDSPDGGACPPPVKRAKGVNRAVVARVLTVDDYRQCLFDQAIKLTENKQFKSIAHIVSTVSVRKRSLAPFDDKRYVVPDGGGVETLPWGHYGIPLPSPNPINDGDDDDVEM